MEDAARGGRRWILPGLMLALVLATSACGGQSTPTPATTAESAGTDTSGPAGPDDGPVDGR